MNIKDFIIDKKIGSGAFGSCYLVNYKQDKQWYVIKEQRGDHVNVKIVINEIRLLRKMKHPNIVTYYASWREANKCYILMEYATKGTLHDLLSRQQSPLKEQNALYLFVQIIQGVHYIHKQNVLHRDLKPGNIMLTGDQADVIKIGDFGIAKCITREAAATQIGTKLYMAPEVLIGQSYAYKCDIWSMGVILYEMLTLKHPFASSSHVCMMNRILEGKPKALPANVTVSDNCGRMLTSMLQRDPEDRPSSGYLAQCLRAL